MSQISSVFPYTLLCVGSWSTDIWGVVLKLESVSVTSCRTIVPAVSKWWHRSCCWRLWLPILKSKSNMPLIWRLSTKSVRSAYRDDGANTEILNIPEYVTWCVFVRRSSVLTEYGTGPNTRVSQSLMRLVTIGWRLTDTAETQAMPWQGHRHPSSPMGECLALRTTTTTVGLEETVHRISAAATGITAARRAIVTIIVMDTGRMIFRSLLL